MLRKQQEINLLLSQIHTIALQGKNNTDNQADFARYKKISDIVKKLIEKTSYLFNPEKKQNNGQTTLLNDFVTPKIRLRLIIFKDDKLLLVRRKDEDRGWALPGGWAALGLSLSENVNAKALQETGITTIASRVVAIKDISKHDYKPVNLEQANKIFMQCEIEQEPESYEDPVREIKFFSFKEAEKLKLSPTETLPEDIEMAFSVKDEAQWQPIFD